MSLYRRVFTEGVDENGDVWYIRRGGPPTFDAAQGSWCFIESAPDGANLYRQDGVGSTNQWTLITQTDTYALGDELADSLTVDWDNAPDQYGTVTDTITAVTFENMEDGGYYVLELTAGANSKTIDWSSAVDKWFTSNGSAPTFSATSGLVDIYTFRKRGATVFGWASLGA